MIIPPERRYEFDDTQNATFAKLAGVMMFVAVAMLIVSTIVGSAAVVVARSTVAGGAILVVDDYAAAPLSERGRVRCARARGGARLSVRFPARAARAR